jgi:phenylacetate-CoA ligase
VTLLDQVYARSPLWLQNVGMSAYGLYWMRRRYGATFQRELRGFREREHWTPERLADHLDRRLRELLLHAARTVPYYREVLAPVRDRLPHLRTEDLPSLPLLEKETIRARLGDFTSEDAAATRGARPYLTSGSTGTPLAILFTPAMHQAYAAANEARARNWAGVTYRDSRVMIGGRLVVPAATSAPPYWRKNWVERQLYMSAFHISPETAPLYAEAIRRHDPCYLVGYASSHYFLARLLDDQGIRVPGPRSVMTSSEALEPEMRATISRVYGCEVFDGYSGVEACCMAAECEEHRLHVSPEVGILEIVDAAGRPVAPGERGEIVGTGLYNRAQPLVRYRTGDVASWGSGPCPCGRPLPWLAELVGRLEDTVIGPDGREMVRFHGLYLGLPNVREGQLVQEAVDHIRLRVAATPAFSEGERATLVERVRQRLGEVRVDVEPVERLERTERGKLKAVVSRVARVPVSHT